MRQGCAVGLYDKEGEKLLFKEWQIETSSELLRQVLRPCLCPGNHVHGKSIGGGRLWRTAKYTTFLCCLIAETLLTQ